MAHPLADRLKELQEKLDDADRKASRAQAEAASLRKTVEAITEWPKPDGALELERAAVASPGHASAQGTLVETPRSDLRGGAALRVIYGDGRPFKVPEALGELQRHGWINQDAKNPLASTRQALQRLKGTGDVKPLSGGRWKFVVPKEAGNE